MSELTNLLQFGQAAGGISGLALLAGGFIWLLSTALRQRPQMQEIQNSSAAAHRSLLEDRIKALEDREAVYQARIDALQTEYQARYEAMQADHAKALENLRSKMEAKIESLVVELRFTRHELNDERAATRR